MKTLACDASVFIGSDAVQASLVQMLSAAAADV